MYGIYVNSTCIDYAKAIVKGLKPIETRHKNTLKNLIGERVAIIRTMYGKNPKIVGFATIDSAMHFSQTDFEAIRPLALIPIGSKYDSGKNGKWCYSMTNAEECEAYELPMHKNHGRSYCEIY